LGVNSDVTLTGDGDSDRLQLAFRQFSGTDLRVGLRYLCVPFSCGCFLLSFSKIFTGGWRRGYLVGDQQDGGKKRQISSPISAFSAIVGVSLKSVL
jgi:hypothetical protein